MHFKGLIKGIAICLMAMATQPAFSLSFSVDLGLETSRSAVILTGLSTGTLDVTLKDVVTGTDLTSPTVLTAPLEKHRYELPLVPSKTYGEITFSRDSTPVFSWRTLLLPKGQKLADYKGDPGLGAPNDFSDYWEKARAELAKVPANTRVTRVPDQDTTTGLLYKVELDSVGDSTFVGHFFVPKAAYKDGDPEKGVVKKFPAILLTPGYGGEQRPVDRTNKGYITFSTNPRNHGPSRAYWKSPVDHLLFNIETPESYYYKLAVLDCLRAAEFVFGRPETNTDRVGCEGSSQGGYLALATAANNPRIACVAADVIAFSDYADGTQLATKGLHVKFKELLSSEGPQTAAIAKSLAYTDGAHLAPMVKCPVQICMAGQDPVCPFICGIVVLNCLPESTIREFHIVPNAKHEKTPEMIKWNSQWMDRWLKRDGE